MSASARTDEPVSKSTRNTVLVMGFRKRLVAAVVIDGLLMAFLTFIVVITVTLIESSVRRMKPARI